jgi:receptor-type tyrosine-protein phosphatase R
MNGIDALLTVQETFVRIALPILNSSAGIGRTGCFIALSNGIKQLNEEHVVDVVRILCNLRRDRGGMIQTNDQYQFLYQALSEYARTLH